MSHFGKTYDDLLEHADNLEQVVKGFNVMLKAAPNSEIAVNGIEKFGTELKHNIDSRLDYLSLVLPVLKYALDTGELNRAFYDKVQDEIEVLEVRKREF